MLHKLTSLDVLLECLYRELKALKAAKASVSKRYASSLKEVNGHLLY